MSELNFKILIVPDQENDVGEREKLLFRVKSTIETCGMIVNSINYSHIRKSEDEDYPEIEELIIQVQAKIDNPCKKSKILLYKDFCSRWKNHKVALPCSYIVLYGNDCFKNPKKSHHNSVYESFSFGVLPHNNLFYKYATINSSIHSSRGDIDFYHDTRNVVIHLSEFEMRFSYDNIRNVFVNIDSRPYNVFFDLFNPPIIFRNETRGNKFGEQYTLKHRNLDFRPVLLESDILDILLYIETYDCTPLIDVNVLGRANVLSLSLQSFEVADEIISGIHYSCSEKSIFYSHISSQNRDKPPDPVLDQMHFGCTYLLTAIFQRNFTVITQASDVSLNLRKIKDLSTQYPDCLEKALTAVLSALDSGKIINFWHAIEIQYKFYISNKDEINFKNYVIPEKCCMIRRIMLTPTRLLLWPQEIMYGNRILRNFDSDYALRVSFRDDNMCRMSYNAVYADQNVFEYCIENPMMRGIHIGSRHYEFLAWSNSQIRDHGVWMYARDLQGKTSAKIRTWMGDFSHIHNVPKYMARMGQCFSQTEDALSVPLDPANVKTENDIESGYDPVNSKPYCFSDGVGRMSLGLTAKVHDALDHDKHCSAFQIRYGGYKGMLVTDPTLKYVHIVFRKSMKKFDSPQNIRLEIAKTSAPIKLQLNRPFISLLGFLGVRHRTFLRLQEEMLKILTDMLFDETKAAEFLTSKTPFNMYNYEDISRSGIYLTTEPYFKSLLLALHRHNIENIKKRANLDIDPSKGRNMLGVLDETGLLRYGEVFVQYTTDIAYGETTNETEIVRGEVMVTKNPCLFPGDVRKFNAVDIYQLHHIVDCIVFPQKGDRPHPSEMAGSDLDGDEYAVIWEKSLIFYGANKRAADFPAVQCPDVLHITVEDMINFLQSYIKNDQVGVIANAHLAFADDLGCDSKVCLSIAEKFSVAVDFAKNGQSRHLDRHEKPKRYPDFMEKDRLEEYKSIKALGKMYRVCRDFESENQDTSITYQNVEIDPDLVYEGWEKYKNSAIKSRNKYNILFRSVLRNYGIQHEAEAFSGAFTNLHCRFQERKDRHEIEKVIIGCIKKLMKSMAEEFLEEFKGQADINSTQNSILQKASAWYIVTYSEPDVKFLSFPWTVSKYLTNIKVRRTLANPAPFSPAIMCLDKKIVECEVGKLLPDCPEKGIWNEYDFLADKVIVKRALQVLILWAEDEEIIQLPGEKNQGLLYLNTFIKLFFHIAELFHFVKKKYTAAFSSNNKSYSSGELCIEFLKHCSSFRFYTKEEMRGILPFELYSYNKLAKRAVVSYHKFALSGILRNLYFDKKINEKLIQMKSILINSSIFNSSPIAMASLKKAEAELIKHSKVEYLGLREIRQTKKVCVKAEGTEEAIKTLKSILRKKDVVLRQLFYFGNMPENKVN